MYAGVKNTPASVRRDLQYQRFHLSFILIVITGCDVKPYILIGTVIWYVRHDVAARPHHGARCTVDTTRRQTPAKSLRFMWSNQVLTR